MTSPVVTAEPSSSLADALDRMHAHEVRHLPVLEGERLAGLVTERDIRLARPAADGKQDHDALRELRLRDVMHQDVVTVVPEAPVEDAARLLYENRIGCLPVLERDRLVGILTAGDLLRSLVELLQGRQPATRVEILMPNRPGELARVVRVIGIDFRINISGLVIPPPQQERALAILHLHAEEVDPLIERLRRLGYEVGSPSLESQSD